MTQPQLDEHEILATRSIALVLVVMTVMFTILWIAMASVSFQAAALVTGLIAIMTWLSYGQQKTEAAIEEIHRQVKGR